MLYADVILPLPLQGCFTYSVPSEMGEVRERVRVVVPLGRNKTYVALVVRVHHEKPTFKVRNIIKVLDENPVLLPLQLRLWQWIADYYLSPLGEVYNAALPFGMKTIDNYKPKMETYVTLAPAFRSERSLHVALDILTRAQKQQKVFLDFLALSHWDEIGDHEETEGKEKMDKQENTAAVVEITRDELLNSSHCTAQTLKGLMERGMLITYEKEVGRLNHAGQPHPERIKALSTVQQDALNKILFQFLKQDVVLFHGVTSSGKTEIYIHLIQQAIDKHQQVLYLLPEIALTVQMRERLQRVFGNRLGIYHSKYSDAERVEIWKKQLSGHPYDVILGARSAVFLPFQRLGLVIVDEEHETSFKQQDPAPRYHARSAAIMLTRLSVEGKNAGVKVLLGTATPSAESYYNAKNGKYGLVKLTTRYQNIQLPEIQVVDVKDLQRRKMMKGPFSPPLLSAVRNALENGGQAILFQNRRGFAPMIECRQCGWVPHCQYCDVSLTYHKNLGVLTCHYCGFTYQVPTVCPCCESTVLQGRGYGTEKIEDEMMEIFPEARVARMDLDTTRTRNAYERIISDFSAGRTNLLIGTQMVTKGLDFDRVSVVGILNADTMLNYPDFRAYEHAYTMMSQVSGRAGRKGKRGLVILQTKNPGLPVIQQVVNHDYEGFFNDMLDERRAFRYPPFYRLIYVFLKHKNEQLVIQASNEMAVLLRNVFGERVLGPDKPSVAKVKTLSIRKMVMKLEIGIDMTLVRQYLRQIEQQMLQDKRYNSLQVFFDVDPL